MSDSSKIEGFDESDFLRKARAPPDKPKDWKESMKISKKTKSLNKDKAKLAKIAAQKREAEEVENKTRTESFDEEGEDTEMDESMEITPNSLPKCDNESKIENPPQAPVIIPQTAPVQTEAPKVELSAREMARLALVAAKKKAEEEGRSFDETEFIIQLVESKRREYEQAKLRSQQALNSPNGATPTPPPIPAPVPATVAVPAPVVVSESKIATPSSQASPTQVNEQKEIKVPAVPVPVQESTHAIETEEEGDDDDEDEEAVDGDGDGDGDDLDDEDIIHAADDDDDSDEHQEGEGDINNDDEGPPIVGSRIRQALLTAKEKAISANQPFDEATAIAIAQEMLARAAESVKTAQSGSIFGSATSAVPNKYDGSAISPAAKRVSDEDQLTLAIIAARKKAQEDGKVFYEAEFTKNYLRKKKKQTEDEKFYKVGAKAKLHFGGESDGFFRDQAIVAAKEARRQCDEKGECFDEDDFMVQFILNKRREAAMARGIVVPLERPAPLPVSSMSIEERRLALKAAAQWNPE
eukprot:gene5484-11031_t